MFAGHYAVGYAVKAWRPGAPLWALFLAVQLLDVLWGGFVLLGIERFSVVPGITALNPLDLYYMPFTHGLLPAIAWAAVAAGAVRVWRPGWGGAPIAVAVLSHWPLDVLVHRPDLPLLGNRYKVGLGLWNHPLPAAATEVLLLLVAVAVYWRVRPSAPSRRTAVLVVALLAVHGALFYLYFPRSPELVALGALAAYGLFAGGAAWSESRGRSTASASEAKPEEA